MYMYIYIKSLPLSEQNKLSLLVRHLCDSCCNNCCMASQQAAVHYVNTWQKMYYQHTLKV